MSPARPRATARGDSRRTPVSLDCALIVEPSLSSNFGFECALQQRTPTSHQSCASPIEAGLDPRHEVPHRSTASGVQSPGERLGNPFRPVTSNFGKPALELSYRNYEHPK